MTEANFPCLSPGCKIIYKRNNKPGSMSLNMPSPDNVTRRKRRMKKYEELEIKIVSQT